MGGGGGEAHPLIAVRDTRANECTQTNKCDAECGLARLDGFVCQTHSTITNNINSCICSVHASSTTQPTQLQHTHNQTHHLPNKNKQPTNRGTHRPTHTQTHNATQKQHKNTLTTKQPNTTLTNQTHTYQTNQRTNHTHTHQPHNTNTSC
jgi:hypothetical protein